MFIELINGSTIQLLGSDNFNSLMGTNYFGVAFSEWALSDPESWVYIRPILAENRGCALFINHATRQEPRASDAGDCPHRTALVLAGLHR